jgi:hypothetical protein
VKYVLLAYGKPGTWEALSEDERARWLADDAAFNEHLNGLDAVVLGEALADEDMATTVRIVDGDPAITDGPFAETGEHLGGFLVIDVPDLDAALDIARRCPAARLGPLEVRPVRTH